eukprot:10156028-Ditylum_brightwellii.AAC.1
MEARTALELTKEAKLCRGLLLGVLVADDDSSMKALVRHSYTECQANGPSYKWPRICHKSHAHLVESSAIPESFLLRYPH